MKNSTQSCESKWIIFHSVSSYFGGTVIFSIIHSFEVFLSNILICFINFHKVCSSYGIVANLSFEFWHTPYITNTQSTLITSAEVVMATRSAAVVSSFLWYHCWPVLSDNQLNSLKVVGKG